MDKKKMTNREKIEICEVVAFLGLMGMFLAGFGQWIFGQAVASVTGPMGIVSLAVFLMAAWKGGVFRG
jgi:hypothetical protein